MLWFEKLGQHRRGLEDNQRYYASATIMGDKNPESFSFLLLVDEKKGEISIGLKNGKFPALRPEIDWIHFTSYEMFKHFVDSVNQAKDLVDPEKISHERLFLFGFPGNRELPESEAFSEAMQKAAFEDEETCNIEEV